MPITTVHYRNIAKRTFNRLWDTLSNHDRDVIAQDVDKETALAKWFYSTVASTAKAKYESTTYWMNEVETFMYPQY